jgi:uncharacterized protein Yka (UPF0111/DUF47 family)
MRWRRRPRPAPELLALFEEFGRTLQRAAMLLRDIFADFPEQMGLSREVLLCEQEGDRIAHDILHMVAATDRGAFDSADVHALVGALDDVVDYAEEAADELGLYAVEAPMERAQEMTSILVGCTEQVAIALRGLRGDTDFTPQLVEIHRLENEADQAVRAGVAALFQTGIDPMVVIRWKDIYDALESSIDACETVANVLEGISLKRRRH